MAIPKLNKIPKGFGQTARHENFLPLVSYVDNIVLSAGVAKTVTVPISAEYVGFSTTKPIWVRYGGTAAEPSGDIVDGTGTAYDPDLLGVKDLLTFSIISSTDALVSLTWYTYVQGWFLRASGTDLDLRLEVVDEGPLTVLLSDGTKIDTRTAGVPKPIVGPDTEYYYVDKTFAGATGNHAFINDSALARLKFFFLEPTDTGPVVDFDNELTKEALGKMVSLEGFNVSNQSNFTGTVPLFNAGSLIVLWLLDCNNLTGDIGQISSADTFVYLLIGRCAGLTSVSMDFTDYVGMTVLVINFCSNITGSLPTPPRSNSTLLSEALNECNYTGTLGPRLNRVYPNLITMEYDGNSLTGSIDGLWDSSNTSLTLIRLDANSFSGTIPSISDLTSLETFQVQANNFTGSPPTPPASCEVYTVNNNSLTGNIPDISHTNMLYFHVGVNALTGWDGTTLPSSINFILANANNLTQATVDALLVAADNLGTSNKTIQVGGTGNAAPSATGAAAAASLVGKGWTVVTN